MMPLLYRSSQGQGNKTAKLGRPAELAAFQRPWAQRRVTDKAPVLEKHPHTQRWVRPSACIMECKGRKCKQPIKGN